MREGIFVNGAHSYGTHGLSCLKRNIGEPPKDEYTERVPYSNVLYDFGGLYGDQTYGERRLSYTFEFVCFHRNMAQDKIMKNSAAAAQQTRLILRATRGRGRGSPK